MTVDQIQVWARGLHEMDRRAARVWRWPLPADGKWHEFPVRGPVLHALARTERGVDIYTLEGDADHLSAPAPILTWFAAYPTGRELPDLHMTYVRTAWTPDHWHVFHVFGRESEPH